jgi:RimJ/RimL family protein N-acetyltransferase
MLRAMSAPDDPPVGEPVDGGPARPPRRTRLEGRYVSLAPVDPAQDAEPLWRAAHDGSPGAEHLWRYLAYGPFADVDEMRRWLDSISPSEDPLFLTVHGAGGPCGVVSLMSVDVQMRRIEVGNIWFAPSAQRSEANTESVYLMLREAFDELGYRRVEWKCDALNARSRAAAERLGFTFEGVFRQHMVIKGRNRDTAWFAMLDAGWPTARAAFERWLETPADERRQLASLRAGA